VSSVNSEYLIKMIHGKADFEAEIYPGIKGDTTICIPMERIISVVEIFLGNFDYCHLSAITVQKRAFDIENIEVFYNFWAGRSLSLMVELIGPSKKLPSLISLIPGADFYEREAAEMFGIEFTGREETPHLLLPDDWDEGPPFLSSEENDG